MNELIDNYLNIEWNIQDEIDLHCNLCIKHNIAEWNYNNLSDSSWNIEYIIEDLTFKWWFMLLLSPPKMDSNISA